MRDNCSHAEIVSLLQGTGFVEARHSERGSFGVVRSYSTATREGHNLNILSIGLVFVMVATLPGINGPYQDAQGIQVDS